ncbi:hypothetical protein GCM10009757_41500 [Streptomyces cheonanensis]|uniref:OmpR/PhoB-type domain-containing protein n=1 Tax=Streptomyces cheonanensis TaxID=312720 RepID=A0ABN2VE76_9ACTN
MQFRILGPLESLNDGRSVALGGTRQRATLGYLVLRANRVVATSQLLNALWPVEEAPTSARKILQNAVWALRRILVADGREQGPRLVTQPPGYRLSVDPDAVDLYRFQRVVEEGRARLADESPQEASVLLRDALDLWRGPALADLVEAGISWPELTAVQNSRLDVMEDYFDAELACGRHHVVLSQLPGVFDGTTLRERSCGQLMLALYRSGRQADALNVYTRARHALVEDLGLEPGRELQALHQAILVQDSSLNLPESITVQSDPPQARTPPPRPQSQPRSQPQTASPRERQPRSTEPQGPPNPSPWRLPADRDPGSAHPPRASAPEPAPVADGPGGPHPAAPRTTVPRQRARAGLRPRLRPEPAPLVPAAVPENDPLDAAGTAQRRQVSVVLLRTRLGWPSGSPHDMGTPQLDELLEAVSDWVRETFERFGGRVTGTIGSTSVAVFPADDPAGADVLRAVLSTLTVRNDLNAPTGPLARWAGHCPPLSLHAAIATGEALLRYPDSPAGQGPTITGALLDHCHTLFSRAGTDHIRVCDTTRERTRPVIEYGGGRETGGSEALRVRGDVMDLGTLPTLEREFELDLLRDLVQRARHRDTPHLVTVLGRPGSGKTRLLAEFGREIQNEVYFARYQVGRTELLGRDSIFALQTQLVCALSGVRAEDTRQQALAKVTATIQSVVGGEAARQLLHCLTPLLGPVVRTACPVDPQAELDGMWAFFERMVLDRPLVLVIDDLHRADNALLEFVSGLADFAGVPLLAVASARPELFDRRSDWGGGKPHFTSMTLEPLSDTAMDTLFDMAMGSVPMRQPASCYAAPGAPYGSRATLERLDEGGRRIVVRTLLSSGDTRGCGSTWEGAGTRPGFAVGRGAG